MFTRGRKRVARALGLFVSAQEELKQAIAEIDAESDVITGKITELNVTLNSLDESRDSASNALEGITKLLSGGKCC